MEFNSLLEADNCHQYVESATHIAGHLLDVFIARIDLPVHRIVVSPPGGLLIVAYVSTSEGSNDLINRRCHAWGLFDIDNFMGGFDSSPLSAMLPDTADLFDL